MPVAGYNTEFVIHGWCNARPMATFLAKAYDWPLIIPVLLRVGA